MSRKADEGGTTGLPTPRSPAMVTLEALAVALTLWCVWLAGRGDVLNWPVGIAGAALYGFVFFRARLYSEVVLQAYFLVTSVYGWYMWSRPVAGGELPVTRLAAGEAVAWCAVLVLGTCLVGRLMQRRTRAALPYWDATILLLSLVAQYLLTRKVLECWVGWIAVDALAIGVYLARRLYLSAALYAVLLVLAIRGLLEWLALP